MATQMTNEKRARRYLQASMSAGATGLPDETRQAHEAIMRGHEGAYPDVREHALAGTDQDFDKPLTAGEREHQAYLRDNEGLQHAQIMQIRKQLRAGNGATQSRARKGATPNRRTRAVGAARAGARGARSAWTSRPVRQTGLPGTARETGSIALYAIGVGITLALVYLLINERGQGPKALSTLLKTVTTITRNFIAPTDPLRAGGPLDQLLGNANSSTTSSSTSPATSSTAHASFPAVVPLNARRLPSFGPAPGIPITIGQTPIGVGE